MPKSIFEEYNPLEGKRLSIMDEDGNLNEELRPKELTDKKVVDLYKAMVLARAADKKALSLQRQGRMATFAPINGQEASSMASVFALKPTDWIVQSFREQGALVARNLPIKHFYLYYLGIEEGSHMPKDSRILPVAIPVGSQALHGAGLGWGAKLKGDKVCALTFFGDGATSEGDVHEAMNFAGVMKANTIFFCQNNQWAISVPRAKQTASETIAQKAVAYGIDGIQIDGNDIFAVYRATAEAAEKARNGKGATLIESYTYRLGDHTTADDAKKYRDPSEVEPWLPKDPLIRTKKYLEKQKLWDDKKEEAYMQEVEKEIEKTVAETEATPVQTIDDIFNYTYKEMPPHLKEQRDYLKQFYK